MPLEGARCNVITPEQRGNYHKLLCDSALGYCVAGSNAQYVATAFCIGVLAR
jgi:hypothetical protein